MTRFSLYISIILIFISSFVFNNAYGQSAASPSSWLFPDGNYSATKLNHSKPFDQQINDFKIKMINNQVSGVLQLLIVNLVDYDKISTSFPYAPNEIVVVSGREIIILDGAGRVYRNTLGNNMMPIKSVSMLFDSLATVYN